jgi:hypothetical protein
MRVEFRVFYGVHQIFGFCALFRFREFLDFRDFFVFLEVPRFLTSSELTELTPTLHTPTPAVQQH